MPKIIRHVYKPAMPRKRLAIKDRRQLLDRQNNNCIYCGHSFGEWFVYRGNPYRRDPHFDHLSPYSLSFNSEASNFVAACFLCNSIKHNKVFETLEEAREHIHKRLRHKGVEPKVCQRFPWEFVLSNLANQLAPQDLSSMSVDELTKQLEEIAEAKKALAIGAREYKRHGPPRNLG